jgi:hypothetical protein
MIEFPKWKYHAELDAQVVHSKEAEHGLGEGWLDLPYVAAPEMAVEEIEAAPEAEKAKPAKRGPKPKAPKGEE